MASASPTLYARMELSLTEAEKRLARFNSQLDRNMGSMERRTARAAETMQRSLASSATNWASGIGKGALAAGLAMLSFSAVIGQAKQALDDFGDIADKSAQSGLDPEFFQALAYQASLAGVGMDELSGSLNAFNKNAGLAVVNKGKMVASLKVLNPALLENIRNAKSQEERVKLVADAIDRETDASRKAAIATAAFGDVGTKLVSVMQGGAAAIDATANKARALGIIVDRDMIARADELGDAFDTAAQVMNSEFKKAIVDLGPILIYSAQLAGDVARAIADIVDSMRDVENQSTRSLTQQQNALMAQKATVAAELEKLQTQGVQDFGQDYVDTAAQSLKDQLKHLDDQENQIIAQLQARSPFNPDNKKPPGGVTQDTAPPELPSRSKSVSALEAQKKAVVDLIANLEFERSLVGKSEVEQAKMNALREAGAVATADQKTQIETLIDARYREQAAADAVNKSLLDSANLGKDLLGGVIEQMRAGASAGDILVSTLDKITDKLIDMQLNSLFLGSGSGNGPLGGLFQPLLRVGGGTAPGAPRLSSASLSKLPAAAGANMVRMSAMSGNDGPSVVVHNYAGVQVRTEERQDQRGGRRVEVILEEQMASALARPGSAAGRALKAGFGVRQSLVKR